MEIIEKLNQANENVWFACGVLWESMQDLDKSFACFENVLRHNNRNIKALTQIATIYRMKEKYSKAVEYLQQILRIDPSNGEIWSALGHCYLMMEDLQQAYSAYQQALNNLPNPKDPTLWYGIGILYDRYGSFEHAEEAFNAVLKMDPTFDKKNEIQFRLGIIYKHQNKFDKALQCFRTILNNPPRPLPKSHILFQIGHVYELKKDIQNAKEAYENVLKEDSNHAQVLQQLGWLYHNQGHNDSANQEKAITLLLRSIDADPNMGQTWYLLGRCYMSQQKYKKAYDAYQQAVIRDVRNPTFWCSIGVLYYQINQYNDALDAYTKAIKMNPYSSEVWYDLATLYESCNQFQDSLAAYKRSLEFDPNNAGIQQKIKKIQLSIEKQDNIQKKDLYPSYDMILNSKSDDKDNPRNSTLAPINIDDNLEDAQKNNNNNTEKEKI